MCTYVASGQSLEVAKKNVNYVNIRWQNGQLVLCTTKRPSAVAIDDFLPTHKKAFKCFEYNARAPCVATRPCDGIRGFRFFICFALSLAKHSQAFDSLFFRSRFQYKFLMPFTHFVSIISPTDQLTDILQESEYKRRPKLVTAVGSQREWKARDFNFFLQKKH